MRQKYQDLLRKLLILNDKHYDYEISINAQLRKLENLMPPTGIQSVKKNMYNQNMYVQPKPYFNLIHPTGDDSLEAKVCKRAYNLWMEDLANSNGITYSDVVLGLGDVLNLDGPKVSTIVLIGESNSGKSLLSRTLRKVWKTYECGIIQSCPGRQPGDFWLQDCPGKSVYVCEELYLNTKEICQRFKGIMEGNETLDTNVKFLGNKALPRRPFVVTMNGSNEYDLAGDFMEEFTALKNRCFMLVMNKTLTTILPQYVIDCIVAKPLVFLEHFKYEYQMCKRPKNVDKEKKLLDWLYYIFSFYFLRHRRPFIIFIILIKIVSWFNWFSFIIMHNRLRYIHSVVSIFNLFD